MIKVKVTKSDIKKGRLEAGYTCGCPIWHALNRELKKFCDVDSASFPLRVTHVTCADFDKFKINLPNKAREFQRALMKDFTAKVKPFTFKADIQFVERRSS